MITVLAVSPAIDVTYLVDAPVTAGIHRPTGVVRVAGGKGLNCARAAHALGAEVVAVPVLGGHFGRHIAEALEVDGVPARTVCSSVDSRLCISIESPVEQGLVEVYEPSPDIDDAAWASVLEEARRTPEGGWLAMSGSLPASLGADGLADLEAVCRERDLRLAVDTHGPALRWLLEEAAPAAALLKVNRSEAQQALGAADATAAELARRIHALGVDRVVITDGVDGSAGHDADGPLTVVLDSPLARSGRYPVGSGDSYLGALLFALDAGDALADAMTLAAAAATANAHQPGPARFDLDTVAELRETARVERF